MLRHNKFSVLIFTVCAVFFFLVLSGTAFYHAAAENRKDSQITIKVSPDSSSISAGKSRHFSLKSDDSSAKVNVNTISKKGEWTVNGIVGGKKSIGKINKKGVYRAPKKNTGVEKVTIGFNGSSESNVTVIPATIKLKDNKAGNGRLNLRVKWKKNGSSKAQEKAPSEIKSVKGIATKEDEPDKGKEFLSNPAIINLSESRELVFNVPLGSYTVFLQAFDEENGKGNVIYEGTKAGVEAVESGGGQHEPKPVTIFLIEKGIIPTIDVSPVTATLYANGTQQFSALVEGVITDAENPVRWLIFPGALDELDDFLGKSEMAQTKSMMKWGKLYGSIDDKGLYKAPTKKFDKELNIAGLLKSSVDDGVSGYIYDTALVTVIPPLSVSVSPQSANVTLGETKQFTAEVSNVISDSSVDWSVIGGSSNGTIDSNGLYTAPSEMPADSSVKVRATSVEDNNVYGEATVTLESPEITISLVAPDIPDGSIYNLLAISTTGISEATSSTIAETYEAVFIPQISEGWDPVTGTILNVKGNILIVDIPDGLPFGECNVTLKNKLNSGSLNTLTITILPPFEQTLSITGIGEDSGYYSSGICTDKLYDSNGDFYVSLGAYGDGTTMGKIIKINPLGEQSLVTDNAGYLRGIDMDSNGDIFAGETYYDLGTTTYYDRLIRIPSGSDTPLRDFTAADFLYDMFGVVVGPDGNIYATNDISNESIYQYSPSGGEGTIYTTPGDETIGLAFNSEGYLFMAENDDTRIFRAPPGGGVSETFIDESFYASSIAVDYQDNILVGTYSNYVAVYDKVGTNLGDWFKLNLDEIIGVKTDLNNNLYLLDITNNVFRYTAPQLPDSKPTIGGFEIKDVFYNGEDYYANVEIKAYYSIQCECTWSADIDGTGYELSEIDDNTLQATVPLSIFLKSGKISVYLFSGDNSSNTINFPIPKEIFILPAKVFLNPGETNSFIAYFTGIDSGTVTWSVAGGATFGSIDSSGLYTAPLTIPSAGKATVTATSSSEPSISGTAEVIMANIYGTVSDNQTQEPIEGAEVIISGTLSSSDPFTYTTNTDVSGNYIAVIPPGAFSVEISKSGYQNYLDSAFIGSSTDSVQINVELSSDTSTVPVGSVSGKVLTSLGEPIDGAVVTIDGGEQTNYVFAAATSGADGFYEIKAIPIYDTGGSPISVFTVSAIKDGFTDYSVTGVQIITNTNTANVDLYLTVSSGWAVYFSDDFETDKGWTVSGDIITDTVKWQRIQNPETITNTAYPLYVTLPPDDTSEGDLPSPYSGEWCLWFGDPNYGNFMGTPSSLNISKNGGASEITHSGSITSSSTSLITIPSTAISPKLRFWAWWEIEGQNPNGFDVMNIYVLSSEVETQILSLNPVVDPVVENRDDKPYTSAGFFRIPIWVPYEIDLSAYTGQDIQIIFRFNTADESFNGFRGWFIDDVKVVDTGSGG